MPANVGGPTAKERAPREMHWPRPGIPIRPRTPNSVESRVNRRGVEAGHKQAQPTPSGGLSRNFL